MDTIFAVSSGAPPAAIAVLRVSGPQALDVASAIAGSLPEPRRATVRALRDPADGQLLDQALILVFRAPGTATGEDLVEFHLHGGRAVVAAVEKALRQQSGLRQAEPGEFTRRALANGRIDLTEAEGLGDLLAAETETQRRTAMLAAEGGIRRRIEQWSDRLLKLAAQVEAELDFSDEDDVAAAGVGHVQASIASLVADMTTVLAQAPVERVKDGIRVVLAGPPNSGKSSLFNAMIDRDAAIVSPLAGTTRDRIDAAVQRHGIAFLVTDTAGLNEITDDMIERIGIARAQQAMDAADIVLWLGDDPSPVPAIPIHARADLPTRDALPSGRDIAVSARTGIGIDKLWGRIAQLANHLLPRTDEIVLNARQRDLAEMALAALLACAAHTDLILAAEHLREARAALDLVTGHSDTEAMLDALFGTFCIGK